MSLACRTNPSMHSDRRAPHLVRMLSLQGCRRVGLGTGSAQLIEHPKDGDKLKKKASVRVLGSKNCLSWNQKKSL